MDIVKEIRRDHGSIKDGDEVICYGCSQYWPCSAERGAVEIERLRALLKPFAHYAHIAEALEQGGPK